MYKCDQLQRIQKENLPLEGDFEEVSSLLRELFTFEKIIESNINSVTVRVNGDFAEFGEQNQSMAFKIVNNLDIGFEVLQTLCYIKESILDSRLSPCFLRCDNWTVCSRLPEVDRLGPSPISIFSPESPHLYMLINVSDYSLGRIPYQPTQYQVKCLIFELLYAIMIGKKFLKGINIREDNIILTETQIDRLYTIGGKQFRVSNEYLPIFTEFSLSESSNAEVSSLIQTFAYFMNSKVDLSELLVNQFENLVQILNGNQSEGISTALSQSTLFDDLNVESTVSQALQRELLSEINTV